MMKNFTKLFALAVVMMGFSLNSSAQSSASTIGVDANATIIAPITLSAGTALSFGDVVGSAPGGTVVLGTDGSRTPTGVSISASAPGTASSFDVTGEANYTYAITLPTSAVTLSNGVETMDVTAFTSDQALNIGTLDAGGLQTFTVGATLTLGAAQASGAYSGTYDVTVAYN